LLKLKKKIVEGNITTAVPLNEREIEQIKEAIKEQYLMDTTANLLLTHDVDASIVGGYILKVAGFVFDHSRIAQIEKVQNKVLQTVKEKKERENAMIRKHREEDHARGVQEAKQRGAI